MDRFLMHVTIGYPPVDDEVAIVNLVRDEERAAEQGENPKTKPERIPLQVVFDARRGIAEMHVSDPMKRYIADLVNATRYPGKYSADLERWIDVGSSPRASIALDKCSRTHAWLGQRDYVDPEDVRAVAHDCLRHRLMLSYAAQGEGIEADTIVDQLLEKVALP